MTLGYAAELVKERAKQHFQLTSFNDITTEQLRRHIDRLLKLQAKRGPRSSTIDHLVPPAPRLGAS